MMKMINPTYLTYLIYLTIIHYESSESGDRDL